MISHGGSLAQSLVLLIGINDISGYATPFAPDDAPVSAQELIDRS
nr:hypothetical protein [Xanthomonas translucens]CCP41427.1 hypothetical protein BN444_03151 [Xanthomonas translucens pv. translucens DSM 18974]